MQGQVINGFELKRLLGRGGMAEVWYAENEIGKPAAVKILNENLSNSQQIVERFHNEALVMVKLNHPNIRQEYGYGYIGNRHCIIMEYLDGSDLEALLKSGRRFTDEELRKWWNQTVDALNYTHAMDIVHRDIKPSNIFLDNLGNIKLLDYGIAKVRESISMTQTGAMMGTLMYMSPEQVDDAKHLGPKSDIYSLAVTFVHLLTGQVPYDSTSLSDFKIRESIVYKPLDLSGVPIAWQGFLAPYLEKNPEDRPALRHFEEVQPEAEQVRQPVVNVVEEATRVVETPQPEPRPIPKPQPQPTQKPQPKPVESETQTFELDEKPKSKKGLWIGLGIAAAAVAVLMVLLLKPKNDEPIREDSANGHNYVDLGLPSGTLWATCNVGANNPEDYGDYFAWGETLTKTTYSWDNYKYYNYYNDEDEGLTKYCNKSDEGDNGFTDELTTLQDSDDPSTKWGSGWHTPNKKLWDELLENTKYEWTMQNGVNGRLFTAANGNSLFLPAAGFRGASTLDYAGSEGYYWSSSLHTDYPGHAWNIFFDSGDCYVDFDNRKGGFTVRPVRSSLQN